MFDPENRDDQKPSLLAFGSTGDARAQKPSSASLLAMGGQEDVAERPQRQEPAVSVYRSRREVLAEPPEKNRKDSGLSALVRRLPDILGNWVRRPAADHPAPMAHDNMWEGPAVAEEAPLVPSAARDDATGPEDDQQWKPLIDPMKVFGGIARSKLLIVATTLLGALIGVAIALSTPKKYEASTELLIDPRDLKIVERDLTQAGFSNEATLAIVENQVRVITSGTVLNKVVEELKLDEDPEFNGTGGGGLFPDIRSLLSRSAAGDDPGRRRAIAITHLAENLSVARGGKTFVVVIGVTTQDGEKSALIANTMADVFLKTYGELQSDTAGRATEELTSRLDELRAGVEAAERKVENFKAENDIIDAQGRLITDDQILKLNEQLSVARAHTLELNAKAASTKDIDVDSVLGGALPEEVSSSTMTELRTQYAALKSEADRLAVRLGPRHPQLQAVEAQLAGARTQLSNELRRIIASVQTELKRAVQLEQELASRLAQLKVRQGDVSNELVTLRELERNAASQRAVYEAFLLRARETGQQKDLNTANMSVISVAYPPLRPNGPSRSTMALTGLMLGLFAGIGLGGMRGAYESLRDTANERRRRLGRTGRSRAADRHRENQPANPGRPVEDPYPFREPVSVTGHIVGRVERSDPSSYRPDLDSSQAPIEEIRASLRDFRRDVEELAQSRTRRRYF
ncbi:succinoglycan biosynthesis protein exop [Pseudaminobacter arsenicus]|uniref:Succinoglycan biosynthesis protein exop n=1 Tax=Borborobacter arsenicus TaxID=1851146 RepID=A0A432VA67_9HYPH|nr:GumC family protein [Pseudaminobacter arsenicus]RUM99069.1 succinoglycan biosynthesis protein exop [Pseudaminobacter arsenicus]